MAAIRLVSSLETPAVHENAESHPSFHGMWKFENSVTASINLSAADMAQFTPKVRERIYEMARHLREIRRGASCAQASEVMFDGTFEQSTILRTGPDGLTRVVTRSSWDRRESVLVDPREAELVVFRRWVDFHREVLGFMPSWGSYAC